MNNEFDVEMSNDEIEIDFELYPKGPKGEDGFSPIIRAIETTDGYDIEITDINGTRTITVLNGMNGKDGLNGQDGQDGKDAKINGKNSIEIEAGNNITIDNTENGIRINSTGGSGGTSNYNDLSNKPKINNVELNGNKSLNDLGIQPKGNYLTSETDPTVPSYVKNITQTNITNWNNKSDFSGDYNDLSNKPTIPDVSNFITKDVNNLTNYTLKTNTGSLIDLEINDTTYVVTLKLKNQDGTIISTDTIDLPLESVVVSGRYDNTTKKVILTLENGSEVDFSVADLVAGLQTEITSSNKLASDLVDDTNSGNKFVTTSEKQTWNGKYDKPSTGIPKTDLASDVQTSLGKADTALQSHQDISGKLDTSKVKNSNSTTAGDVYDVRYINTMIGDVETILTRLTTGGGVS